LRAGLQQPLLLLERRAPVVAIFPRIKMERSGSNSLASASAVTRAV
jgi:hypothetical protein